MSVTTRSAIVNCCGAQTGKGELEQKSKIKSAELPPSPKHFLPSWRSPLKPQRPGRHVSSLSVGFFPSLYFISTTSGRNPCSNSAEGKRRNESFLRGSKSPPRLSEAERLIEGERRRDPRIDHKEPPTPQTNPITWT